ncbi:MAG: hypothetical protein K6G89_07050 [Clostridia bacterium]|nr:hypothetical protein [Clostridia bacterium]
MQDPFNKAIPLVTGDPDDLSLVNVYTDFFDEFETSRPDPGSKLVLKVNADSEFAVWVNGLFVMTGQHSQYPDCPCVEYADITSYVRPGLNAVAFTVYRQGLTTSTYLSCQGQFFYEITEYLPGIMEGFVVAASSGDTTLRRYSPCYKSGPVPQVSGQLGFTFIRSDIEGGDEFLSAGYTKEQALKDGFSPAPVLEDPEFKGFTVRNIEKLSLLEAKSSEIVAQGIFDFGREYRETNTMPHAYYMQNAALKSRFFGELLVGPPVTREIPAADNYALEPGAELSPPEGSIRLKAKDIVLTGALREGRGIYAVIDLGEEIFGYLSYRITLERPAVIGIGYSDHLIDLRTRSFVGGRCFAETLILPAGETARTHLLSKIGARYLMIFAETDDITLSGIGTIPAEYPVNVAKSGVFKINDALHTKICSISLRTLLLCMNEHYMDCPQREQSLYAMDSRNQMLCGYYGFGEYAYAKESLSLMSRSLRNDGLLELCSPAKVHITIPSFSLHWVIALCEYTKYSGDVEFFNDQLKTANTIMGSVLSRRTDAGVLLRWAESQYWNFHEWNGELAGAIGCPSTSDADACLTALFILATEKLADILDETGADDAGKLNLASRLKTLAGSMKTAFNDAFFDAENGLYASFRDYAEDAGLRNYSQFANSLAILSGCASKSPVYLDGALKAITGRCETVSVSECTLSTCLFKYDALMSVSKDNIGLVMDEITELWGYMIGQGATSFWETIKGATDFDDAGSLCHGWSAIPLAVYYKYILGIAPVKCGFAKYEVKPAFWNNHYVEGQVYLPAGSATLHVKVEGNSFSYEEKPY